MTSKIVLFTIITVALLATLVALVALHAPELAMITVATALGGAIQATFGLAKSDDKNKGPGGAAAVLLAVGAVLAGESAGCASPEAKRAEAAGAYANEVARCDDAAPTLPPNTPIARRREAWAEYDDCISAAHQHWGITETVTARKDGGP